MLLYLGIAALCFHSRELLNCAITFGNCCPMLSMLGVVELCVHSWELSDYAIENIECEIK